jgi:sigma-B regulation protein RsbU (phosphoserine phosphatase)
VPVSEEFLSSLAPDLGVVQMTVWRPAVGGDSQGLVFESGGERFVPIRQIVARNRSLPPRSSWLDFEVTGTCKLEAVSLRAGQPASALHPVFAPFSARASQLNRRLFSSLGELGGRPIQLLFLVGIVFLLLEIAALRTGIQLTRSITRAVDELSSATQQVQAGDLSHTVRVQQRDQLGALGESFNEMIASISSLIEEQRQRQKLENELTIAREVQAQLFPQSVPALPGFELAAVCHAARVVSGDYYDFIRLGPNHVAIAIADISGKGISAALLMASLQAALRSQVLLGEEAWRNTAELVSRLNLHLYLNTSADRYATLFYAVYDGTTRTLTYTNAGHLPPYYVLGDSVTKLEEGGMVVGLFKDVPYDQGTVQVQPGSLLVAYSDGLIESENVYGEQFGQSGLLEEILRQRSRPAKELADALVQAAEVWAGSPEQADDMTVIVAQMG